MPALSAVTKSTEEFAKVKSGLDSTETVPHEYLWWLFLGLAVLIALSFLVTWLRKKRRGSLVAGWTTITEPHRLGAILKRAVDRQADCTLEIFDHQHTDIYRGQVFEADPDQSVILELAQLPDRDVDFEGFPAQVHLNFRPAPKQAMEHYQFSSHTLGLALQREKSWRVARVAVAWPKSLISAQRRDFLRVEPAGEYALTAALRLAPETPPPDPDDARPQAEASVLDLSVNGIQLLIPGPSDLPDNQTLLLTLDLPVDGLEAELKNTRLHLLFSPLYRDLITLPGEAHSSAPRARTVIRGNFIGRYRFNPETKAWYGVEFNLENFQDLTHWIHAYQRFRLKKEKGLMPVPMDRVNAYPSLPPERPPPRDDDDEDDAPEEKT